jgi:hypothetical protein
MSNVSEKVCVVEGCDKPYYARGFCKKHYKKFIKRNDLLPRRTTEERFWLKVDVKSENECWDWAAAKLKNGYGRFATTQGQIVLSHRFSYELVYGEIPEGKIVRHKCDNPSCCNFAHLEIGTHADNTADMIARGRSKYGEKHPSAILTETQVVEILKLRKKMRAKAAGKKFGVSPITIYGIWERKLWKHL